MGRRGFGSELSARAKKSRAAGTRQSTAGASPQSTANAVAQKHNRRNQGSLLVIVIVLQPTQMHHQHVARPTDKTSKMTNSFLVSSASRDSARRTISSPFLHLGTLFLQKPGG
ncbi:hypothetical protein CKAH01_10160 [Colletotrichum kahawae]|uniref:Uncharacterized protein n=1 Tax=Colletotrichum kahawae TaxID=34407 RepID=A0AAD9XY67_COLKA|nr:hypothetical protein CKAH01_10160 [Colletotrichum kahawae]